VAETPPQIPDAFRKTPAAQFGTAVGQVLAPVFAELPGAIAATVGRAVRDAQVLGCAHCRLHRARFTRVNGDVIQFAWAKATEAARAAAGPGTEPDPRTVALGPYLPAELQHNPDTPVDPERMPGPAYPAVTMVSGDLVCDLHLMQLEKSMAVQDQAPAAEGPRGVPRKEFLVSQSSNVPAAARAAAASLGLGLGAGHR
jgi:hypothetical protein